jgi:hypothetical protein
MEAKELLNKWVEEIDKPWIKNKVTFLLLGARGEFETIRCIIGFKEPEADEIDRLKEICNSRIDRLEPFTSDLITFISISVGSLLPSLSLSRS